MCNSRPCLVVLLMLMVPAAWAELRDPTRPSGYAMPELTQQAVAQAEQELQLQAIFYHPQTPGVLINGRRYQVGERVGNARIDVIDHTQVQLTEAGETRLLKLTMPAVKREIQGEENGKQARGNE